MLVALLWAAAASAGPAAVVAVPIPPLEWLVKGIAGEAVEVVLLVPPGASAEQYDPKPAQLRRFERAELFFALDTPVERRWLPRLARMNEALSLVALDIPAPQLDWSGNALAGDALRHPSDSPEIDFHAWNSPSVMATWIDPVLLALSALQPEQASALRQRAAELRRTLSELDERVRAMLAPHAGRSFLTLHPAWGYFARDYGLVQMSIESQGHEPGARTLARLIEEARARGVNQVYLPPRANDRHVRQLAQAIGAEMLGVDDLAPDYPQAIEGFAEDLVRGFAP